MAPRNCAHMVGYMCAEVQGTGSLEPELQEAMSRLTWVLRAGLGLLEEQTALSAPIPGTIFRLLKKLTSHCDNSREGLTGCGSHRPTASQEASSSASSPLPRCLSSEESDTTHPLELPVITHT